MKILKTIMWTASAIYIGLFLAGVLSLFWDPDALDNPYFYGEFMEGAFLTLVEAVIIAVPYGILWFSLSLYSPRMLNRMLFVPVIATLFGLGLLWLETDMQAVQLANNGDFTLGYVVLGVSVIFAFLYALALKHLVK